MKLAGPCGRSPVEIVGSNPTGGHEISLVQRSPTDCGASLFVVWKDRE